MPKYKPIYYHAETQPPIEVPKQTAFVRVRASARRALEAHLKPGEKGIWRVYTVKARLRTVIATGKVVGK